jgi:hypothetical protein
LAIIARQPGIMAFALRSGAGLVSSPADAVPTSDSAMIDDNDKALPGICPSSAQFISGIGQYQRRPDQYGAQQGRHPAPQQAEILKRRAKGETLSVLAASYGVNRKTIIRLGSMA